MERLDRPLDRYGKLRIELFVPLPGEISVSSQTCSSSSSSEKKEEEAESVSRRADKRGQGEGSTRDYFYTRHADLLGADLEPRSFASLRLPRLSESRHVIYFSIDSRGIFVSSLVGEKKNSVFIRCSRDFFFFVSFLSFSRIGIGIDGMIITVRRRRTIFSF